MADIPRTKSGKIVELAVRNVVHGRPVKNQEALANPEALAQFRVWKGQLNELPVGFTRDFVMSLPKESADKIQVTLESRQPLVAPIEKGQEVGMLALTVDGKPYGQYPVLALQDVPVAGFFGRLWDAIVMFFKSL